MIKLSAIVCTYNREKYILQALNSLNGQSLSKEEFEIIVINNNSTDRTELICKQFEQENPNINYTYKEEENQGLSYARNRGILESKSPLIAFIDDDAYLDENYLKNVVNFFEEKENACAIGGKILLHYLIDEPKWVSKYLASLLGYFNLGDEEFQFTAKSYPRGSNMVFKKSLFNEVGFFNTDLGRKGNQLIGGEEKEIFQRIYKTKKEVYYLPQAIVYHLVPEERTKASFIKKQAIGTGVGERCRVKNYKFKGVLSLILSEIIKWGASVVLFFYYLLTLRTAKGIMIVRFRIWILMGIITK